VRNKFVATLLVSAALVLGAGAALSQTEDNVAGGAGQAFPLAAAKGADSGAINKAPPGAANQGPLDPAKWKYGPEFRPPANAKIWNPVMIKMMAGQKVTGGTVFAATDPQVYCTMADAGYDFIWTEMQHDDRDWGDAAKMWATCPHAGAVPGVRVAYGDEREIQHALDSGAMVLVVPTVRSYEEAVKIRNWAFFPPLGDRSAGGGPGTGPRMWGNVPGGYRATVNDNLVLILMIETLQGAKDADRIAKIPGVTALFAASGDLGNRTGYAKGTPDYERVINVVHDAAIKAGKRLCGPFAWKDRPDFTCFQNSSEMGLITRAAKEELGPLWNTQGKPQVGPDANRPVAAPGSGGE
jgi:2-keto-3-deoxy-L-rhamnonate aldolase RhmA